ncbi:hypothetical protein DFH28DRAFT_962104, partial [Melampsora americana]
KKPPAASKCQATNSEIPKFENGNCPTYRGVGDYKKNNVKKYRCDLIIGQGKGYDGTPNGQDRYGKYNCEVLTNIISCTGSGTLVAV